MTSRQTSNNMHVQSKQDFNVVPPRKEQKRIYYALKMKATVNCQFETDCRWMETEV